MVFDPDQLRQRIEKYLAAVREQYRVERAILYGSYAKGTPREDSDIDLIILSPDFKGTPKLERHQKLGWISWQARTTYIEPLGFTPEEYESASPLGLLAEARETGRVVYEAKPSYAIHESSPAYQVAGSGKMKIVIPLAGFGKRLRPHTFTLPKPLINVAGKPMLGHVLDMFATLDNVEEIIFIIGHLGEKISEYVERDYPHIKAHYFEQKELNGQSPAIYLAREHLHGPMLMVFVDTIIQADLSVLKNEQADVIAWVKAVDDPRRFGVAEVGPDGFVTRLIEKPKDVKNNLAVVGFYYFKNSERLVEAIQEQIERDIQTQDEYFLADAVNIMLQKGARMRVEQVEVWLDCGKAETVLETNRYLLEHGHDNSAEVKANSDLLVIPPVNIHPTARIVRSVIGPHATIAADCQVEDSIIRDSILNEGAIVHGGMLTQSLIGQNAKVGGRFRSFNVGEASEIGFE
jgi:glucose-1-phosphate thymidylyltransferase